MNEKDIQTLSQVESFLEGSQSVAFVIPSGKAERYQWVSSTLDRFYYHTLSKQSKGVIQRYIQKISGYSRQQVNRLIKHHRDSGVLRVKEVARNGFATIYTDRDIQLLAELDKLHETPSGHIIKKLCQRSVEEFNEEEYLNLSGISVSHLYNLRKSQGYQKLRRNFTKTSSKHSTIGVRRRPQPNGKPGYIRIDTVHQGDLDKEKGVYYINAVDEVTQFQFVCSVERISENYLLPVLDELLKAFPFTLHGFHSDNGTEYVNKKVAQMLERLYIEFTKSRSRHSNDNGLVESKNGSVIRKFFGYGHIQGKWAKEINYFNQEFLNPYLNFHKPCYFPRTYTDAKGKQRKKYLYHDVMTPYEKLRSLPEPENYLKKGVTLKKLDKIEKKYSDNEAAKRMNEAKKILFNNIYGWNKKSG